VLPGVNPVIYSIATPPPPPPLPEYPEPAPLPPPEPAKEVAAKVITELPDVALKGRLWLKSLPEDGFVLEHESFETVKEARAFIKDKEWLINARIAPVFT
jgi:hypothetical protein